MKVELVKAVTEDQVPLHGALLEPAAPHNDVPGVGVVLMMHGNGGNFYSDFFVEFAEGLARRGCPSLRVNNRGHDIVNRVNPSPRFSGVAFERPAECLLDYKTWIDWLAGRGYRDIVLWGHSRGAVKVVYYQAHVNDHRLRACILASPPWLSYARFVASDRGAEFLAGYRQAERMVAEGNPEGTFMAAPMSYVTGAGCYLEKYGPDEPLNIFRYLDKIRCPVLAFSGTDEVANRFGFAGLDRELDAWAGRMPNLRHVSIPGADHYYTGRKDFVLDAVLDWLKSLG